MMCKCGPVAVPVVLGGDVVAAAAAVVADGNNNCNYSRKASCFCYY